MSAPTRTATLLALLLALPAAGEAKVVGIILPESCGFYETATEAFKQTLAANGFGPGKVDIYVQKPAADTMSWTNAVRKFAAIDADLIMVWGDGLLQTACREKLTTPVGYGFVLDPAFASCARTPGNPKGTAAGVSARAPLQTLLSKVRLMTEFKTVGVFTYANDKGSLALADELRGIGGELGFSLSAIAVPRREDSPAALRAAADLGLFVMPPCTLATGQMEELLAIAAERRIPTVSLQPPRGGAAPLLSLYPSPEEQGRISGELAAQILAVGPGAAPAAPVQPKRIELEINLPLARQLGVKVPMALLEAATKVIK